MRRALLASPQEYQAVLGEGAALHCIHRWLFFQTNSPNSRDPIVLLLPCAAAEHLLLLLLLVATELCLGKCAGADSSSGLPSAGSERRAGPTPFILCSLAWEGRSALRCLSGTHAEAPAHSSCRFILVLEGAVSVTADGSEHSLSVNDFAYFPHDSDHRCALP